MSAMCLLSLVAPHVLHGVATLSLDRAFGRVSGVGSWSGPDLEDPVVVRRPASLRPSRLLVVNHSCPSGVATTVRSRPYSPSYIASGLPVAPSACTGIR